MSNAVATSQLSYSQQDLQDFVTLALAEARGLGASDAEVGVSVDPWNGGHAHDRTSYSVR